MKGFSKIELIKILIKFVCFILIKTLNLNFLLFYSQGYPCPINYNPADHFILTLAMVPGQEQACRKKIKVRC